MTLPATLSIAVGGGLGAAARHGVDSLARRWWPTGPLPFGTLIINVSGSLALGLLLGVLAHRSGAPHWLRPLLASGFLGGYTTFSTLTWETVDLADSQRWLHAVTYVAASVIAGLAAAALGLWLARLITAGSSAAPV